MSVLVLEITAVKTSAFAHKQHPKTAFNSIRCIPFDFEIVQIYEGKTSISKKQKKNQKTYCKKLLHSHKVVFWSIGTGHTSQNCNENTLLTFNGHMIHLSVGTGSLGLDGAGATGSPSASHNSSKDEWMI